MQDCVFCKILSGELPGKIIYETDEVIGLIPLDQVNEGHTLLIPKKHSVNVLDTDEDTLKALGVESQKLAKKLLIDHKASAVNLLHAAGEDAQQMVFHYHMHIIPRVKNDGLDLWIKQNL